MFTTKLSLDKDKTFVSISIPFPVTSIPGIIFAFAVNITKLVESIVVPTLDAVVVIVCAVEKTCFSKL